MTQISKAAHQDTCFFWKDLDYRGVLDHSPLTEGVRKSWRREKGDILKVAKKAKVRKERKIEDFFGEEVDMACSNR